MFGGAAIYCDGQVFGLVDGDVVYLKVDGATRPAFEAVGFGRFIYRSAGKAQVMASYHRMPERLLDDPHDALAWARRAIAAARTAATAPARHRARAGGRSKSPSKPATRG
jgi:DNA transformation protein